MYQYVLKYEKQILIDSGEILYINNGSFPRVSGSWTVYDLPFEITQELETNKNYILTFQVTTINGYKLVKEYNIHRGIRPNNTFTGQILVNQDAIAKENGYAKISLSGDIIASNYILQRSNDLIHWDNLVEFTMSNTDSISKFVWYDKTVLHAETYYYALIQYTVNNNKRVYSERLLSLPITIEFEDLFLSDDSQQLCIRFDPKIANFKEIVLEQKVETLGGQFPFFLRNAVVHYKEFPISGLISYQMDSQEFFISLHTLELNDNQPSTNLTNNNIGAERHFKLKVLEWLNNGQPKLFRSPTEGNYIVRLTDITLSPNDTLGRMLHSFSATCCEIANCSIENLKKYKIFNIGTNASQGGNS